MGCFNSKATAEKSKSPTNGAKPGKNDANKAGAQARSNGKSSPKGKDSAVAPKGAEGGDASASSSQTTAEQFLRSILEGTEQFFTNLPDSQVAKQVIALTFANSCAEVVRTKFRLKMDAVVELMERLTQKLKLPLLQSTVERLEERSMDDGYSRIVLAWHSNNPTYAKKIPVEAGQAVLDTLYIRYVVNKPMAFEDIMAYQFRWISVNQAAMEVFSKATEGRELMTLEELGKFLREVQGAEVTERQTVEKYKYRFGGGIHRYNCTSYVGSVLTNNVLDPTRTSDVWQDMTQSFTHYLVSCVRVETEDDVKRAATEGARALVLNIKKNSSGTLVAGTCELQKILDGVKKNGFTTNTYPIVLCLSPSAPLPAAVQEEVAKMLNDTLGPMLQKGLMFEGAVLSDPKFSPGALRKKVLVMGQQSDLKPFIGFLVADMAKDGLGVRVTDVMEGTPAAKGGVLKDDWLTHINGDPIRNKQHLREALAALKVGEEFVLKRENLDTIKVVVGGSVNSADSAISAALSDLVFFKYAKGPEWKPWDTQDVPMAELPQTSLTRKELSKHFAFCSIDSTRLPPNAKYPESLAAQLGIQFVDIDNSERCLAWGRGRFCDNGRCGYVLRTDVEQEKMKEISIDVIGGPRLLDCPPLSSMSCDLHGEGSARVSGNKVTFSNTGRATIAVLKLTFDAKGAERTFTASFNPSLLRTGYRALPSVPSGDERSIKKQVHGIFCFVK